MKKIQNILVNVFELLYQRQKKVYYIVYNMYFKCMVRPKKNMCVYGPPTVPNFWPDPRLFYCTFI